MDLTAILDECLDRLAIGETVAGCVARYPEHARDLEPMLRAAQQVRTLSELHLTYGQRTRGKMALRDVLTPREKRARGAWWGWFQPAPVALVLAVVLFIGVAFTAVAASRPGDLAYPVRIAAEQVGVWVQFSAHARANREVDAAARRLGDLQVYLARTGQVQSVPLAAMLRNDAAAAQRAQALTEDQRVALAKRMASHVDELNVLADDAVDPETARQLRQAAVQVGGLVVQLRTRPDVMPVVDVLGTPTPAAPTPFVQKAPSATAKPEVELIEPSSAAPAPLPTATAPAGRTGTRTPPPGPGVSPTIGGPVLSSLPAETPYRRRPTAVLSFTPSATASASSTWTPWPTGTPTVTRTRGFSATPAPSRAVGRTATVTRTPPIISTRTRPPIPVETITIPALPILSATPKWWPTATPSQTATAIPTLTWTWTPTSAVPTVTPTPTGTSAPDVWATATARAAGSATIAPTALPTPTPTITLSPTPPPTIRWRPIPTVTVVGPVPTTTVTVVMPPFLTRTAAPPIGTVTITVTPSGPRSTEVGATSTSTPTRPRRSR